MPPRYTLFLKTEILTGYLGGSTFALRKLLSVYHAFQGLFRNHIFQNTSKQIAKIHMHYIKLVARRHGA